MTPQDPAAETRADRVAGLALCAAAGAMAWQSARLPLGSLRDPGAGFLPFVLALALGAFGAALALWPGRATPPRWPEARHAVAILGSCVAAALLLERLGWRLTSLLLLVFLIVGIERRRWWAGLAVSVLLSFGTWWLFVRVLKVPLPAGPFGF